MVTTNVIAYVYTVGYLVEHLCAVFDEGLGAWPCPEAISLSSRLEVQHGRVSQRPGDQHLDAAVGKPNGAYRRLSLKTQNA